MHITGGSQITIQGISHVIVHGLHIHDMRPSGPATIRASSSNLARRGVSDGDAIHILNANNVWVDLCYLANAADGLINCTHGSTAITISNNYFTNHNKVVLFGSHPTDFGDRSMRIAVAYNKFGPGLTQRMPRYTSTQILVRGFCVSPFGFIRLFYYKIGFINITRWSGISDVGSGASTS